MIIISLTIMAPGLAVTIIEKPHSPCDRMKTACIHIEPRSRRLPPQSHDHRTRHGVRWPMAK